MKYYLEGRLLAVGVVDMVEEGLSSVYFFDPAYKEYRLGVFSSLLEIEYVRWMSLSHPHFTNYYMGFYIANCDKMNYKGSISPTQPTTPPANCSVPSPTASSPLTPPSRPRPHS
jgi:arginine-tRNA-protein transferase